MEKVLSFITDNPQVNAAFRIALGDLTGNIYPYKGPLAETAEPAIMAGLDYDKPWCRDAAINAWNGASLIYPAISKNTLLSILDNKRNKLAIGGQYWDAIIWTTGAWNHYLYTGDLNFLATAFEVSCDSMAMLEEEELAENGLFNGPACYGDGVGAYPIEYADCGGDSEILAWPKINPALKSPRGYGIPMQALSTNCLYFNAYVILGKMAAILNQPEENWPAKAAKLKDTINRLLWNKEKGYYNYITGPFGDSDYHEGMGNSFAILFGIADKKKNDLIFKNTYVSKFGIPCVWPVFPRYQDDFGRHNGTVWPHIQGFWADAAARNNRADIFAHEFFALTESANRECHFTEIIHPLSGRPYGGLQEKKGDGIATWDSCRRQTWSATAYIRMALFCLAGMRFSEDGISFSPVFPQGISKISIRNLHYHGKTLNFEIAAVSSISINGKLLKNNKFLHSSL